MTEAIFGLVGVVVGSVITGGFQWATRRADKQDRKRAVVRFLVDDLLDAHASLDRLRMGEWPPDPVVLRTPNELRDELGVILDDLQWARLGLIRSALDLVELLRQRHEQMGARPTFETRELDLSQVERALAAVEAALRSFGVDPGPRLEEPL